MKRLLAAFLAILIVSFLVASCGGNSDSVEAVLVPGGAGTAAVIPDDAGTAAAVDLEPTSAGAEQGDLPRDSRIGETDPVSTFKITFFDVGKADAALVECDGMTMLIDGGDTSASSLIYSVLERNGITHLDYIVATHADKDHVGGLAGALNFATVGTAFCPVTSYDTRAFESFVRYLAEQGKSITIPKSGDEFMLGSASVLIIGPVNEYSDSNNNSIVLKITYGSTSFLFTGDAERKAEQDILDAGYDLSATVLKVGHHGSNTSTTYPFLREIMPAYAVISCGAEPNDDTLSRLRDADVIVYRTDLQGDIFCISDGETVSFTTSRN